MNHFHRYLQTSCIIFVGFLLISCGFQPLYGDRVSGVSMEAAFELSKINIETIPNREGQILRNLLLERLNSRGQIDDKTYHLTSTITYSSSGLGVDLNEETERAQLNVQVVFTLSGKPLLAPHSFTLRNKIAYNINNSLYATGVARDKALERALIIIADDAQLQLAILLAPIAPAKP